MIIAEELLKDCSLSGMDYTMEDIKKTVYSVLKVDQKEVEIKSKAGKSGLCQ